MPIWEFGDLGEEVRSTRAPTSCAAGSTPATACRACRLRWGVGAWFSTSGCARARRRRNEKQTYLGDFETETSGYTMLDWSSSLRVYGDEERGVSLLFAVDNLNDVRAQRGFAEEGRAAPAGAELPLRAVGKLLRLVIRSPNHNRRCAR